MRYGEIIQKAWKITWRYKFLWVLAIFAGITGPGGGGGGSGSSFNRFPGTGTGSRGSASPFGSTAALEHNLEALIGLLVLTAIILVIIGLVFFVLSVAARGGLIWATDQIETGVVPRLGPAWRFGFSRFWRMLFLHILLGLPLFIALVILIVGVVAPIVIATSAGQHDVAAALVPVCGLLVIGIPIVLVLGFVISIMLPIAERAIVLDNAWIMDSIKRGWWAVRHRFKDSALMWLVSLGLGWGASLVFAIPVVLLSLLFLFPAIMSAVGGAWGTAIAIGAVWLLVILILSFVYVAIWGTFTSAMWTIFYRRLVGKEQLPPSPSDYANAPPYVAGGPFAPPPPYTPGPPVAPSPYAPQGPPMAATVPQPPAPPAGFVAPTPPMAPQAPGAAPQPPMTPEPEVAAAPAPPMPLQMPPMAPAQPSAPGDSVSPAPASEPGSPADAPFAPPPAEEDQPPHA